VVSFTPQPFYPRGKSRRYPLGRRLGGRQSRSGRYGEVKILYLTGTRTLGRQARSQSLHRRCYRVSRSTELQLSLRESNPRPSVFCRVPQPTTLRSAPSEIKFGKVEVKEGGRRGVREPLMLVYTSARRLQRFFILPTLILTRPPFSMSRRYKVTRRPCLIRLDLLPASSFCCLALDLLQNVTDFHY
jgi:hypothetical protein